MGFGCEITEGEDDTADIVEALLFYYGSYDIYDVVFPFEIIVFAAF